MIDIPKWMYEIDQSHLPGVYRDLADLIGYEGMLRLISLHGGGPLYVPKLDALEKAVRDYNIMLDYSAGRMPQQLAHKYNLSLSQVYEIIKTQNRRAGVTGEQLSLLKDGA
ncbi:hypothetical protein SDC9_40201 [bioreactor metagenome]|uniref:Mor transcription activator domain-containing protein n=1 Tax=bioreactor metagenome TaxID=1076179 RepID=A0A644VUK9_9ZZZZ